MRSKLRTALANVSGGSRWLHTGNLCKATRQISLLGLPFRRPSPTLLPNLLAATSSIITSYGIGIALVK
jgi:hypothetical protein